MARVGERGILGIRDDPKKRQSCGAQGSEFGGSDVSFTGVEIAEHDDAEFAREMIGGPAGGRAQRGDFTADAGFFGLGVDGKQHKRVRRGAGAELSGERLADKSVLRIGIKQAGTQRNDRRRIVEESILLLLTGRGGRAGGRTDQKLVSGTAALIDEGKEGGDGGRGTAGDFLDGDQIVTAKDRGEFGADAGLGEFVDGKILDIERSDRQRRRRGAEDFGGGGKRGRRRSAPRFVGRSGRRGGLARSKKNKAERGRGRDAEQRPAKVVFHGERNEAPAPWAAQ